MQRKDKKKTKIHSMSFFLYQCVSCLLSKEDYISVQLDESRIISAGTSSRSCLEAKVSYSPAIQRCDWETPDGTLFKCTLENWVTNNRYQRNALNCQPPPPHLQWTHHDAHCVFWCRSIKFCPSLQSGDYKLHLEVGEKKETKTISVCVVGGEIFVCLYVDTFCARILKYISKNQHKN